MRHRKKEMVNISRMPNVIAGGTLIRTILRKIVENWDEGEIRSDRNPPFGFSILLTSKESMTDRTWFLSTSIMYVLNANMTAPWAAKSRDPVRTPSIKSKTEYPTAAVGNTRWRLVMGS